MTTRRFFVICLAIFVTSCAAPTPLAPVTAMPTSLMNNATSVIAPLSTKSQPTIDPSKTPTIVQPTPTLLAVGIASPIPAPTSDLPQSYPYGIYYAILGVDGFDYGIESDLTAYQSRGLPDTAGKTETLKAIYLEFAHFADRMAYWTPGDPSELWVSDLSAQHARKLFTDTRGLYSDRSSNGFYEAMSLIWTPDDGHLIVEIPKNPQLNLIYHIETGQLEPFPYVCEFVALSQKSGRLATWCVGIDHRTYVIIERNGQIWKSKEPPNQEIIHRGIDGRQPWAWSADGEQFVYYDGNDKKAQLAIADAQGNSISKICNCSGSLR